MTPDSFLTNSPLWPIVSLFGMLVLAVLYFTKTWRSQASTIDSNTIASLKNQIEAVSGEVLLYKNKVLELTQLVGKQEGIIETQKDTIERYERILQNRNPELTDVLKEIRDFMKANKEQDAIVMAELKAQTELLVKDDKRHVAIDTTLAALIDKDKK